MKIYKYKNYDEYIKCQQAACQKKFTNVWCVEENIQAIAEILAQRSSPHEMIYGLCHGVRQGYEQKWFMEHLFNSRVIGSEIGDTPAANTIQHDFNKVNPAWVRGFNFVYSNSFDHAFDPKKTLTIWKEQLKPGGCIILEYDRRQEHTGEISQPVNKTDPVSLTVGELCEIVPKWFDCKIEVVELPVVTQEWRKAVFIWVS